MNIDEVYYAIQAVNSNSSLDEERRNVRINIYQALMYNLNAKGQLEKLMNDIVANGKKLEKASDYAIFLNEDLEKMRVLLKGYILDSRFVKELHNKGVFKYSFEDLEKYLNQYISATGDTIDDVKIAMTMYPKLLEYKDLYLEMIEKVKNHLGEIFGDEMLKNSGDVKFKYECIFERIERMSGRDLFDEKTKDSLEILLNEVFSFYVNNVISIPIESQIDVSGTKEMIA